MENDPLDDGSQGHLGNQFDSSLGTFLEGWEANPYTNTRWSTDTWTPTPMVYGDMLSANAVVGALPYMYPLSQGHHHGLPAQTQTSQVDAYGCVSAGSLDVLPAHYRTTTSSYHNAFNHGGVSLGFENPGSFFSTESFQPIMPDRQSPTRISSDSSLTNALGPHGDPQPVEEIVNSHGIGKEIIETDKSEERTEDHHWQQEERGEGQERRTKDRERKGKSREKETDYFIELKGILGKHLTIYELLRAAGKIVGASDIPPLPVAKRETASRHGAMTGEEKAQEKKDKRKRDEKIRRDFKKCAIELIAIALRMEGAKYHKLLAALVEAVNLHNENNPTKDATKM